MKMKKYTINDIDYNVSVNSVTEDRAEVTVNGVTYQVKISNSAEAVSAPAAGSAPVAEVINNETVSVSEPVVTGSGKAVNSPLPGVIVGVKVKIGENVKAGQTVAILEAMKMENEIQSEYTGTVVSVNVSEGDSILEGAPIVTIG